MNFLILAAVLGWLLFRPIRQTLAMRRAALAQEREDIAAKRAEVERLQDAIRQRTAAFDAELDQARQNTLAAAQQEAEHIRAEARASAERERAAARSQLAHLEEAQLERLGAAVAAVAGASVQRLLQQLASPDLDRGLGQAACRELQGLQGATLGAVMIEAAHPLDQDTQSALTTVLGDAARTATFRVTPTLGAGLRISTSQGVIDASVTGLAAFAQRVLATRLGMSQHDSVDPHTPIPEETLHHA
jgi:F0F1-type ATP synthase membrane subunit b/b'